MGGCGPANWKGRDGAIAAIIRTLQMPTGSYNTVKKVLEDGWKCLQHGEKYVGAHRATGRESNHKAIIRPGSTDEQLIADLIEDGVSLEDCTERVNIHRKLVNPNKIHVGISAVRTVVERLNPDRSAVSACSQGSTDPNSPWARARYLQFQQHRLRLGRQRFSQLPVNEMLTPCFCNLGPHKYKVCPRPPHHRITHHTPTTTHHFWSITHPNPNPYTQTEQSTFWDETHPKCQVAGIAKGKPQVRFPRGLNGRLDVDGTLNPKRFWLQHKYQNEVRIMPGCGMKRQADGTLVGHRLPTFNYTGCWVHSIGIYQDVHVRAQIGRIKTGGARGWTEGARPATGGPLYKQDTITRMPGISAKTQEKLNAVGINVVEDFCRSASDEPMQRAVLAIPRLGKKRLKKWQRLAAAAEDGEYTSVFVDHRRAENPYLSRYGDDDWETAIARDLRVHHVICITEIVRHMHDESEKFFADTEYAENWWFFHDALSQLSDKRTKAWMQENGYLKRWLLPVNGCCAGTCYFGRPVGNTPEVMPWDCSLNRDIHCRVSQYESMSRWIKEGHPLWSKRFTTANQKQMVSSYMRVLDPETGVCPSSKRIVQDITRCWGENIDRIVEARGVIVPNLGSRTGHRVVPGVDSRGGKRVKKPWKALDKMHPHAEEIWNAFRQRSMDRCEESEEE